MVEKNLMTRFQNSETERAKLVEMERGHTERVHEMMSRISLLEAQLSTERQEKLRLNTELQESRVKIETLQTKLLEQTSKLDSMKSIHDHALEEAKENYQRMLRQHLQDEKDQWEAKLKLEEKHRMSRESENQRLRLDITRRQESSSSVVGQSNDFSSSISVSPNQKHPAPEVSEEISIIRILQLLVFF